MQKAMTQSAITVDLGLNFPWLDGRRGLFFRVAATPRIHHPMVTPAPTNPQKRLLKDSPPPRGYPNVFGGGFLEGHKSLSELSNGLFFLFL